MSFHDANEAISAQFVRDFMRRDAKACASAFANDAVLYHSTRDVNRGRSSIEAWYSGAMKGGFEVRKLTTVWEETSGDLGCAIQAVETNKGLVMVMVALKRDGAGTWKVRAEAVIAS